MQENEKLRKFISQINITIKDRHEELTAKQSFKLFRELHFYYIYSYIFIIFIFTFLLASPFFGFPRYLRKHKMLC